MKHVINILVTLILVAFAAGITYVQANNPGTPFGMLYVPLTVAIFCWGNKLDNDY